jgi:ABC-type Na+ efflux pump permease subunit
MWKWLTIYAKDMRQSCRDTRAFTFLVAIPTIIIPLLVLGINRAREWSQRSQATSRIRVLADPVTHRLYVEMVYSWFRESGIAAILNEVRSAAFAENSDIADDDVSVLLREQIATADDLERWLRKLVTVGEKHQSSDATRQREFQRLPPDLRHQIDDFQQIAIRGLARLDFIAATPPSQADLPSGAPSSSGATSVAGGLDESAIEDAIHAKRADVYLNVPGGRPPADEARTTLIYESSLERSREGFYRIRGALEKIQLARCRSSAVDKASGPAHFEIDDIDLATPNIVHNASIGILLPFLIMTFLMAGGLHSAVDAGVGEKLTGTLETLLIAPVDRWQIAFGKFLVVFTYAMITTSCGVLSVMLTDWYFSTDLSRQMDAWVFGLAVLLIAPAAAAVSALFLAISVTARSTREVHAWATPINFVLIAAALSPRLFHLDLSWWTALIPFVNVSVLSAEYFTAKVWAGYYALTLVSSAVFSAACLTIAILRFKHEAVLLRM